MKTGDSIKYKLRQWIKMLLQAVVLPLVYALFRWQRVDPSLVVFADAHHDEAPDSLRLLLQYAKGSPKLAVKTVFHDYQGASMLGAFLHSLAFMPLYARAGHVVICDNFLPVSSCRRRPGTHVLQLWHGCGAFKKFGYDTPDDIPDYYRGNVFRNYTAVAVSGPVCVPFFTGAMRQPPGVVQALGVPRTDIFFTPEYKKSCRARFFREYPEHRGKTIVLWTPTFRGTALAPTVTGMPDIRALSGALGDGWLVVAKLHPHMDGSAAHGLFTAPGFSAEALLFCADLLITDYSSIIFEFSLLEKPMLFFAPDLAEYQKNRGFYLNYNDLPGPVIQQGSRLAGAVADAAASFDPAPLRAFRQSYMSGCDGRVCQRLILLLEQGQL